MMIYKFKYRKYTYESIKFRSMSTNERDEFMRKNFHHLYPWNKNVDDQILKERAEEQVKLESQMEENEICVATDVDNYNHALKIFYEMVCPIEKQDDSAFIVLSSELICQAVFRPGIMEAGDEI